MDPLTTIVSAIIAGAIAGTESTAAQAVKDAYAWLKALIVRKFGSQGDVKPAVEQMEKKPESVGRKETLKEELAAAGVDQDEEVLAAARKLLALAQVQTGDAGQVAIAGHGSAAATGRGAAAVGNGNIVLTGNVDGDVTIGDPPKPRRKD